MAEKRAAKRIIQVVSTLAHGDGIGGIIMGIHEAAGREGIPSEICARNVQGDELKHHLDAKLARLESLLEDLPKGRSSIFHYGVFDAVLADFVLKVPPPNVDKVFYFHNITPPRFFRAWNPTAFKGTRLAAREIDRLLRGGGWTVTGDSDFNIRELSSYAGNRFLAPVLPPSTQIKGDSLSPESKATTGEPALLFVGRFAPNKRQDVLLYSLRELLDSGFRVRLTLLGKPDTYLGYLRMLARLLKLGSSVEFVVNAKQEEIIECYRSAQFFVIASEHEGFCVPVLEALHYGCVPVARPFGALEEILAGSPALAAGKSYESYWSYLRKILVDCAADPAKLSRFHADAAKAVTENLAHYCRPTEFVRSVAGMGSPDALPARKREGGTGLVTGTSPMERKGGFSFRRFQFHAIDAFRATAEILFSFRILRAGSRRLKHLILGGG